MMLSGKQLEALKYYMMYSWKSELLQRGIFFVTFGELQQIFSYNSEFLFIEYEMVDIANAVLL